MLAIINGKLALQGKVGKLEIHTLKPLTYVRQAVEQRNGRVSMGILTTVRTNLMMNE